MNLIRVKTQYQTIKMVELSRKKLVISIGMRWMCLCLWLCWCSSLHAFHSMSRPLTTSKLSHIVTYSTIKKRSDSLELAVSEEEEDVVFAGVKFPPPMATSLRRLRIQNTPSPIQQAAIAPVSSGMSFILHAATGTGKTYAFLLPALKKLYAGGSSKALKTPLQVLIIVPTKELALQVSD